MTAEEYRNLYAAPTAKPSGAPPLPQERDPMQIETRKNVPIVTPPEPTETVNLPVQKRIEEKPIEPKQPEAVEAVKKALPTMPEEAPPAPVETAPAEPAPVPTEIPEAPPAEKAPTYTDWRIVGEVFHSYVIVETDDKMLLIDKHAAHERILFEQLKAGLHQAEVVSQLLMLPVDVMLTTAEVEALKEYNGELEKIGFALRYARNTVSADAIPEGVESGAVAEMLESMLGTFL
jgi:DNA mismatch repair protein MutL